MKRLAFIVLFLASVASAWATISKMNGVTISTTTPIMGANRAAVDGVAIASGGGGGIAFDAKSQGTCSIATTITQSHTCAGSNRVLFVTASSLGNETCNGVTYMKAGNATAALTQLWERHSNTYGVTSSGWIMIAPDAGTNNIVVTFSAAAVGAAVASSWTGVNQTTPNRTVYQGDALGGSPASITAADAQAGDVVVDGYGFWSYGAGVPVETGTLIYRNVYYTTYSCGSQWKSASGSTVMNWTNSDYVWDGGATALIPQ